MSDAMSDAISDTMPAATPDAPPAATAVPIRAVRRLDPILVDRIAAGEVVERPASAVKELVENAIDAGATSIEVTVEAGGRRLIRVVDDGAGMSAADLALAVERHATSKLPGGDLARIDSLGFRGEALPSIGAVARLSILTRAAGAESGSALTVEAGLKGEVRPAPAARGTRVEVADLFSATPARLKFLKSDRAENAAIADIVRRLALAKPALRVALRLDGGAPLLLPAETGEGQEATLRRLSAVLGADFSANALPVEMAREGFALSGFTGLPTYHRGAATQIHFSVNGRPVRDKLLLSAVRGAYADTMASDRHPVLGLAIACDPSLVDVNVHPAKTEVRFREPGLVRALVVSAIHEALRRAGLRAATTGAARTLEALRPGVAGGGAGRGWIGLRGAAPGASGLPSAGAPPGFSFDRRTGEIGPGPDLDAPPPAQAGLGEAEQAGFGERFLPPSADIRPEPAPSGLSGGGSAPPAPSSTRPTSSPRPATASSSSTSTPPTNGSSTSG